MIDYKNAFSFLFMKNYLKVPDSVLQTYAMEMVLAPVSVSTLTEILSRKKYVKGLIHAGSKDFGFPAELVAKTLNLSPSTVYWHLKSETTTTLNLRKEVLQNQKFQV